MGQVVKWSKIKSFFNGKCSVCGRTLAKGDEGWYCRSAVRGKRLRCPSCKDALLAESDIFVRPKPDRGAPAPSAEAKGGEGAGSGTGSGSGGEGAPGAGGESPVPGSGADGSAPAPGSPDSGEGAGEGEGSGEGEGAGGGAGEFPDPGSGAGAEGEGEAESPAPAPSGADVEAAIEKAVKKAVAKALKKAVLPKRIEVVVPGRPAVDATGQHKSFTELLHLLALRQHVWLCGPAGSGKTEAARTAAEKLGLAFYAQSVCEQTSLFHMLGNRTPTGEYSRSLFREAFEHGGVFLLDEIDAGNSNVLTVLNAGVRIKNGRPGLMAFPDGMVVEHPDFVVCAAGNTVGRGANRVYVGRNPIDGATINRFAFMDWDYDEGWERSLVSNGAWCDRVQALRAAVTKLGIRHIVSPRATIAGERLLASGLAQDRVEELVVWQGLDAASVGRVKAEVA